MAKNPNISRAKNYRQLYIYIYIALEKYTSRLIKWSSQHPVRSVYNLEINHVSK